MTFPRAANIRTPQAWIRPAVESRFVQKLEPTFSLTITHYDRLLMKGFGRMDARDVVRDDIDRDLESWRHPRDV